MRKRERHYGLVDLATGELYEARITPWRGEVGGWMKVFQDTKRALLMRNPRLHGQSYRVLTYLETVVGWGNVLPSPAVVAQALDLQRQAVVRAYRELLDGGFILKREGLYYLSPLVGWKGTERDFRKAYDLLGAKLTSPLFSLPPSRT